MTKALKLPDSVHHGKRAFGLSDDFFNAVTGDEWTTLVADASSAFAISGVGGTANLTTGATNNNEAMLRSTTAAFKFAANKPLYFKALVQYAEANTDDANIFVGLSSAAAANLMVDDGAGPATNHSAIGFYKVDSATAGNYWGIHCSLGTTQTSVVLTAANSLDKVAKTAGGSSYQTLEIEWNPISSTDGEAIFTIDGVVVYKQQFTYTSAAAMYAVPGYVKAGGANSEVLNIDRVDCYQQR